MVMDTVPSPNESASKTVIERGEREVEKRYSTLYCSFCGKSEHELKTLITGPGGVSICDECVEICEDLVAKSREKLKATNIDPEYSFGNKVELTKPEPITEIMIDIETLDTKPGCVILQIAAIAFDKKEIYTDGTFNVDISLDSCAKAGFSIGANTLKFWMKQPDEIRLKVFNGTENIHSALLGLSHFLSQYPKKRIWSKGPSFDVAILEFAYQELDISCPWNFRDVRDIRTIMDFYGIKQEKSDMAHDALEDCKSQLKVIQLALQNYHMIEMKNT